MVSYCCQEFCQEMRLRSWVKSMMHCLRGRRRRKVEYWLLIGWWEIEDACDWSGKMEAMWTGDWAESSSNTSVLSIHNLQLHSAVFTRLLLHQKMMDAVMDLMENCVNTKVNQSAFIIRIKNFAIVQVWEHQCSSSSHQSSSEASQGRSCLPHSPGLSLLPLQTWLHDGNVCSPGWYWPEQWRTGNISWQSSPGSSGRQDIKDDDEELLITERCLHQPPAPLCWPGSVESVSSCSCLS